MRFSSKDRTFELNNLFIIWLINKEKKIIRAEVVNLHLAMRAFTDSFIVSNPGRNYTVSELHHSVKNTHFFTGKVTVTDSKKYFSIVVPQVDEGVFPTFVAKRQRI